MKKLNHLFSPYDITLILKDMGFNEPCFTYYHDNGERLSYTSMPCSNTNSFWKVDKNILPAPIYSQVIDWFKEKYGIQLFNDCTYYDGFRYGYKWIRNNGDFGEWWKDNDGQSPDGWDTPEEALKEAIKKTLKLISKYEISER